MIVGGSLGAKIFVFHVCVHVCCFGGISEVLIKYTGKYVKIYFIMKITFLMALSGRLGYVICKHILGVG